jgi:capsular polysaccharide biosynthesis protein
LTTSFIRLIGRHIRLVLACIALGALVATALAVFVVPPSYVVTTSLYVSARGSNPDDRLQNGEYARTHVSSYSDMVDSNDILQAVRVELGLPASRDGSYADLADSITASNPLETAIIDVTVEDSSAEQAFQVASAIGTVYDRVVAGMESAGRDGSPVRISVLRAPALPTAPDSPSRGLYAVAGLLLGLAVGTGLAWLLETRPSLLRPLVPRPAEARPDPSWSWEPDPDPPAPRRSTENGHEVVVRPLPGEPGGNGSSSANGGHRAAAKQRNAAQ